MSWYNSTDNTFIDSTQSFEGAVSSGNGGGNNNIIIDGNGNNTGENTTINDIIKLKLEDNTYNVYINNNNVNGLIKFATEGDDVKVKIEEGKLYIYYDYNPIISLIIPSGWTDIIENVISNRQGINNNSAGLLALGAQVQSINLILDEVVTITLPAIDLTLASQDTRIKALEESNNINPDAETLEQNNAATGLLNDSIEGLNDSIVEGNITITSLRELKSVITNKRAILFGIVAILGFGGSVSAVLQLIEYFKDIYLKEQERENLIFLLKTLEAAQNDANKDVKNKIYISGLAINEATNGGLTDGTYNVNLTNGGKLEIIVKNGNASISNVITTSENYSVNDLIYINKTLIGGTADSLEILVNELYSTTEIIGFEIVNVGNNIKEADNRNRRRQNIPNKDDFTDGLEIVESTTTEESGEVLDKIEIKLKTDTDQFEYSNTGNLQLKNYDNIALKSYVDTAEQNANIYTDGKVQDILTGEGLVSANDLQKVYNLIMNTGLNYDNNNDYSLSLGFKEPFTQQYYNLICVALKSSPMIQDPNTFISTFNPALFNNDFLGFYPLLQRLIETPNIELVKSISLKLSNEKLYSGLLYFKLTDPQQDYKLNKKFEFISHFRPSNLQGIAEYDILQSGVELAPDEYDLDNYKMRFFVASRKLNFSHNIRITNPVYEIDTTYNHLKQRFLLLLPYATAVGNNFDGARAYSVVVNANNSEYFVFGIRNMAFDVPNITDEALKNIALTDDTMGWDMFLHTPKNNPESTTAWVSPVIEMYDTLLPDDPLNVAPSKNVGKIILKFRYIKYNEPTSSWIAINPPDAQVLNSFNLKWRIDFKNNVNILQPDYTEYHNFTSFNLITGTNDS